MSAPVPDHIWNHVVETLSDDGAINKRERQCCRCGLVHAVYRGRDNVWTEFWKGGAQLEHAAGGRVPVPACAAIVISRAA
jgi:hypothetical protein